MNYKGKDQEWDGQNPEKKPKFTSSKAQENNKLKMYTEVISLCLSFNHWEVKEEYGQCGPF